jgi:hypothetical protein
MIDMGPLQFLLGLEIKHDASGINFSQTKYVRYVLVIFHMIDCKCASTPFLFGVSLEDGRNTPLVGNTLYQQIVGSLLYLPHT